MALANSRTNDDLFTKHTVDALNMPLLCSAWVSWTMCNDVLPDGASQLAVYVNHTLEAMNAINWAVDSVANAEYKHSLDILNHCTIHDDELLFGHLAEAVSTDASFE